LAISSSRLSYLSKSIKGFWKDFKKSKRGLVGITIICIYVILAILAPYIAPGDPLYPLITRYPAGVAPMSAELAKPTFQRYLPGGGGLSENMEVMPDYKFSSEEETMKKWSWNSNSTLAEVMYTPNSGWDHDGAIMVLYNRTAEASSPGQTVTHLMYNFTYPYETPPRITGFQVHISLNVSGDVTQNSTVTIEPLLLRTQNINSPLKDYSYPRVTYQGSSLIYTYPLPFQYGYGTFQSPTGWNHKWIWATTIIDPNYSYPPWNIIFPTKGNYTFEIKITFNDLDEGEKRIKVFLDNIDMLIYGQVYGILGSDQTHGSPRDIFACLVYGARLSISLGLAASAISISLGLAVGLVAGCFGGIVDEVLMRITDVLMCLPGLPLDMVLIIIIGRSIVTLMIILSLLGWMGFARSIRSMTLTLRERSFVEAAKAVGAGGLYIAFIHIFPNIITLAYLSLAWSVPGVVLSEASLAWFGLYDPKIVSWGRMISEFSGSGVSATSGFGEYWFWIIPPGALISLLTISFILVGYSLDEIFNPKLRIRR